MDPCARTLLIARGFGLGVCLLAPGCVASRSTDVAGFNAEWKAEIQRNHLPPADLTGFYHDTGLLALPGKSASPALLKKSSLLRTLFENLENGPPRQGVDAVQLIQKGTDRLECKVWSDGEVVWSTELMLKFDAGTGIATLPPRRKSVEAPGPSAGGMRQQAHLFKGRDGCLYVHAESSVAGLYVVLPFMLSVDMWGQWKGMASEEQAKARQTGQRPLAVAISRLFPDFSTINLDGQPVSPLALRGKVALLHFWSPAAQLAGDNLATLARLHRAHQTAGLEIVSICIDGTGTPEQLQALLQEQDAAWRHVFDGEKYQGPLARQFVLQSTPLVFVLNRAGKTILRGSLRPDRAAAFEKRLETLLAEPPPS